MGWKNVKDHYRIVHTVAVQEGKGICIGSPYVSDIIVIAPDGTLRWPHESLGRSSFDLCRYVREMEADPATLRRMIEAPDTFAKSIPVYTYTGGEIIEKQCEEPGWPNVTHDGAMMYENTFSTDKATVVAWAKRNAQCGIDNEIGNIAALEGRLAECRARLEVERTDRAKLEVDYPAIPPAS